MSKPTGLTSSEMRACDVCRQPVAGKTRDGNTIDFHVLTIDRHFLNLHEIQQHAGLAMMLGGNEGLAQVMGGGGPWTLVLDQREVYVCSPCWLEKFAVLSLADEPLGKETYLFDPSTKR